MNQIIVKVLGNIEDVTKKLNKSKFILENYKYNIRIYMIKKDVDIFSIKSINDLKDYAIIEDNNNNKNVTLYTNKILKSKISNISVMVELLYELNYKELLYINNDIYFFRKGALTFKIFDIKEHGVFLNITDDENKFDIFDKFSKLNINVDMSNWNVDFFDMILKKAKEK